MKGDFVFAPVTVTHAGGDRSQRPAVAVRAVAKRAFDGDPVAFDPAGDDGWRWGVTCYLTP